MKPKQHKPVVSKKPTLPTIEQRFKLLHAALGDCEARIILSKNNYLIFAARARIDDDDNDDDDDDDDVSKWEGVGDFVMTADPINPNRKIMDYFG